MTSVIWNRLWALSGVLCLLTGCPSSGGDGVGTSASAKSWGSVQLIETDNTGNADLPRIAVQSSGNAIAVWEQWDGAHLNIYANRYVSATNVWSVAQLVETNSAGDAFTPHLAVDGSGNAVAVWYQNDGVRDNTWANRYVASTNTWGVAQLIETDNMGSTVDPQAAMDGSGNAVVVWAQSDGTRLNIWANRYIASTDTWGTAQLIETDNAGDARHVRLAADGNGNAVALWEQFDGTRFNILTNRFVAATTSWGTAQLIETDNAGDAAEARVGIDGSGNAVVVWQQFDGTRLNIWANRYAISTDTWGTAQLIETDNTSVQGALEPWVAVDGNGNAIAVWKQHDGTRFNILTNRFVAATASWGTAQLIEADNAGDAVRPRIAADSSGNAVAVWQQSDGTRDNIWANRYMTAADTWGTAQLIETDNAGAAHWPDVGVDGSGNAVAVWYQHDGTRYNIESNRFR